MIVFFLMVGLSALDGNQVQTMRQDINALKARVEKLEGKPPSSITIKSQPRQHQGPNGFLGNGPGLN